MAVGFDEATTIRQVDSHTYAADFQDDWTIGTVPHGGYVTACVQRAVRKHFDTTLRKQDQPHTLTLHLDFLRRTQTGPATIKVKDVKLGRQASVVHVTLSQDDREEVVGYITHSNLGAEKGVSFATDWDLHPKPPPVDVSRLASDTDRNWCRREKHEFAEFRKATARSNFFFPRKGQLSSAIVDQWVSLEDGSNFTNDSLGFVVDSFPQIIEAYVIKGLGTYSTELGREYTAAEQTERIKKSARMWFPTLLLNLDVKKALPAEGVRWLFVRLQAKMIRNGRYDLELVVKDVDGELVALSHHVCLAVDATRNTAKRRKVESGETKL